MTIQITPEVRANWRLRATVTKKATRSRDGKVFIPDFDVGKDFTSQFIAVGVAVKSSRDNWRNGGYLSQEFAFPSSGYTHNRRAFNRTEDLLINDVSVLFFPPFTSTAYKLRYFPPNYFSDVKLQIWEYVGVQTNLLLRDLTSFFRNAPPDLLINLSSTQSKIALLGDRINGIESKIDELAAANSNNNGDLTTILNLILTAVGVPAPPPLPVPATTEEQAFFFLQ